MSKQVGRFLFAAAAVAIFPLTQPIAAQESPVAQNGLEEVTVIGSRIRRALDQGPAPVLTIDADTIRSNGYTSIPDVLRAVTQNGGETQSQQSFSGASFTPGAQQVDLRGLGPNHTLVLVNGRRIADFPLPFQGRSNFTDISSIPLGLVERVEVLSGSASAIYGSDAIAGVINFQLKKKVDGTTLDYRAGVTEAGGGASHRGTLTTGYATDRFHVAGGVEYLYQEPLWAYQRRIQDSTADNPTTTVPLARRVFLRYNPDQDIYVDPGQATCASLASLNDGSNYYASRPRYGEFDDALDDYGPGYFCGSNTAIGYGTILSERKGFNSFVTTGFALSDRTEFFADIQFGISDVALMPDVLSWGFQNAAGSSDATFFNSFDGVLDDWQRQFTPEESGGFRNTMTRNRQTTFSVTPGIKGDLGEQWQYELSFNHSEYRAKVKFPEVIASAANTLFLGSQEGIDAASGYPIFNADPARLYTPLSQAEYDSIAVYSIYNPKSWTDNFSATINSRELFSLPAGPVGFAAVGEYGKQAYDLNPDPLALTNYYYDLKDSDGEGSRKHWALGGELRAPLLKTLELSAAARYDSFRFAGRDVGKFTFNGGIEFRPLRSVLIRAAYGTGFRAPDLHYVFTGPGNTSPAATDYYRCRTEEPDEAIGDCSYADNTITAQRTGNRDLEPETSKSINAGIAWAPNEQFDASIDYFSVDMSDQVNDLRVDGILRDEADCRIGTTNAGTPVAVNSPTCQDAIARVIRFASGVNAGALDAVAVNPINTSREKTTGFDLAMNGRWPTPIGQLSLSLSHTHVITHSFIQYAGDPTINKLAFDSGYDIPRDKSTASVGLKTGPLKVTLEGRRLGKLPNYDENAYIRSSTLFNSTLQYDFSDHLRTSFSMINMTDENPVKDPTYASYPYYDISWFDSVGRSFFLQLTYKLGGAAL
ncbi:MAG: TonB-dependent receptor [Pseudomonadales bacterium]|nr:TonB-dependent receptor [Pseudomonadales bacterium]